jgi:DNA-binding IclR family transcriptional regulator
MRVVQTLQKGLAVLDYLVGSASPVRTTDVAEHFGIDKANASRLLKTLLESGWARRTEDRRYTVSDKVQGTAEKPLESLLALRETTHSLLERLVEMSGECAHMAVLVGDQVWYVDKVASPQVLRVDHPVGSLAPLHCTALGKVFLAFGAHGIPDDLPSFTSHTITGRSELEADLLDARRRGFARDDEEFSPGVRCAAAPILRGDGFPVAAVGLSGPSARIDQARLEEIGRLLAERCRHVAPQWVQAA